MTSVLFPARKQGRFRFAIAAITAVIISASLSCGEIQAQPGLIRNRPPLQLNGYPDPVTGFESYRTDINYIEEVKSRSPVSIDTYKAGGKDWDHVVSEAGESAHGSIIANEPPANFSDPLPSKLNSWPSTWPGASRVPSDPSLIRIGTYRGEKWNFTYAPPDPSWQMIVGQSPRGAQVFLHHPTSPRIVGVIETNSDGGFSGLSLNQMVKIMKNGAAMQGHPLDVIRIEDRTVVGVPGKLMLANRDIGSQQFRYLYWIAKHGGTFYIITMWCLRPDGEDLEAAADGIVNGFRIIDSDRDISTPFATSEFAYVSPHSGFSLCLGTTGWRADEGCRELGIAAEVSASHKSLMNVVVSVLPLRAERPSMPGLVRGMMFLLGDVQTEHDVHRRQPVQIDGDEGFQFDFTRLTELGPCRCRTRVFVKNDRAYFVTACAAELLFDDAVADAALAHFRLDQPAKEPDLAALSIDEQASHARFFTGVGLHEFEQSHFGRARTCFAIASRLEPQDQVHVENIVETYIREERYEEALQAIDEHDDQLWIKGGLPITHASLQVLLGNHDQGIAEFRRIFADGYWNEADFVTFIESIWAHVGAQAALDELRASDLGGRLANPSLVVLHVDLLVELERAEEGVAILKRALEDDENNMRLIASLIGAYRIAGHEQESLALAEKSAADPNADAGIWLQKGMTEFQLQRHAAAKASLETANRLLPGVPLIEEMLAVSTAALGQGDTQLVSKPIEAVPLPGGVELSELSVDDPQQGDDHTYCAWRIETIHFERDEEFRRTKYLSYTPRDESAIEGLRTLLFTFNPLFEELYLNRVEVFDAQGKCVGSVDRNNAYLTHEQTGIEATDEVTVNVPVPAIKPGYRIEAVVTTRDIAPPKEFPYRSHLFSSSYPTGYDVLSVSGDVDSVTWAGTDPIAKSSEELVWARRHAPGVPYESHQEAPIRFLPFVELTDVNCQWESQIQEYLERIKDRLVTPEATRQLARQISDGVSPQETIVALAEYVQREFTYQALEFGRHTQIMNSSDTVIANQYGDCKDLSLLLWQMLREHGINAHLALVHSSGEFTQTLETIDQCNHMVVYLPDIPGGHVLDPTNRWGDPRLPVPESLGDSHAVILDPSDPRIVRLPSCPQDQFHRSVSATVRFTPDGSANVEQSLQYEGYSATSFRSVLGSYSAKEQEDIIRQYVAVSERGVEIDTVQIENLHALNLPLIIRLKGTVRNALYDADDLFVGDIPLLSDVHMFSVGDEPARRTPFAFKTPLTTAAKILLVPPDGWTAQTRRKNGRKDQNDFVEWSVDEVSKEGTLLINCFYRRKTGRFPASRRGDYRDAVRAISAAFSPPIALYPGDARPLRTAGHIESQSN